MIIPKPTLGRDCSSTFPSASLNTTNPTTIATAMAVRTRYRIWFSAGVATHGGPSPTQKRATSANGVMRRIPVSASNRGPRDVLVTARAPRVHAAKAIAADHLMHGRHTQWAD